MSATRTQLRPWRLSRFFAASAAIHLLGVSVLAIASGGLPWKPQLEITWLDLDNTLGAPQPEQKRSTAPAAPLRKLASAKMATEANPPRKKDTPPNRAEKPTKKPTAKKARPAEPFTTKKVKLTNMAPGNAALMLLLRMDRIRGTRQADSVRRLLEVFYDYKTLLWSQAIDPVRDFDAMLIATPNPYRVTRTFLAIRHHLPGGKLQSALDDSTQFDGKQMVWNRARGGGQLGIIPAPPRLPHDDRVVLLRRGLALLCRPQHQRLLRRRPPLPKDRSAGAEDDDEQEPTLLQRLLSMDREGGGKSRRPNAPGLLLQAVNLPRLVRLPRGLPPPQNLQVTVPATERALVEGVLTFGSDAQAKRFLVAIAPQITRAKRSLLMRVLGVSQLLNKLRLRADGSRVLATMSLSGREVRELLELFRTSIPQVRVPGMPPRVRTRRSTPPPSPDAGSAAGTADRADGGVDDAD